MNSKRCRSNTPKTALRIVYLGHAGQTEKLFLKCGKYFWTLESANDCSMLKSGLWLNCTIVYWTIRHALETNILSWLFPNFTLLDLFPKQTLLVRSKISDLNEVSRRKIFALDLWTTNILVPHLYTMAPIWRQMLVCLYTMGVNSSWKIILIKQNLNALKISD